MTGARRLLAAALAVLLAGPPAAGRAEAPEAGDRIVAQLGHRTADAVSGRFVALDLATDRPDPVALGFIIEHRFIYDSEALLLRHDHDRIRAELDAADAAAMTEVTARFRAELAAFVERYADRLAPAVTVEGELEPNGITLHMRAAGIDQERANRTFDRIRDAFAAEQARLKPAMERALRDRMVEDRRRIYARYHYQLDDISDERVLRFDYAAVARRDAAAVSGLAEAIRAAVGHRDDVAAARSAASFAVGLLQTIPYDRLESRAAGRSEGFARPVDLLLENRGDCDTKATAFGALVPTLLPGRGAIMVLIEGHAVVGVELPPRPDDVTLTHDGVDYVLAEVAGPGVIPLGRVAEDSRLEIEHGRIVKVIAF